MTGRALVHPLAITLGARPLMVPKRGAVLCVSVIVPFRLSDGAPVEPADWYQTVAEHGGPLAIPDSLAPLPGAELLVMGGLNPVTEEEKERKAFLDCGSISRRLTFYFDPMGAPGATFVAGPEDAAWHAEDNPLGRGGPGDSRPPLIVNTDNPENPLWLGATPFDHPLRLRSVGTPDETSGTGWPPDADGSVLCEAHPAFWAESLHPGDVLRFQGLSGTDLETNLPRYRVSITSGRMDGEWVSEISRIHTLMLIPAADAGAMIWRAGIDLAETDLLGESVAALVAALEDVDNPVQDAEHWGRLAADRWMEPTPIPDDRPLLPAAMAATVSLPSFGTPPEGDVFTERQEAAAAWMREEMGAPEENPFAMPDDGGALEAIQNFNDAEDAQPDPAAVTDLATAALAAGKRRHEEAGFKEPDPDAEREPEIRGPALEKEIEARLSGAYMSSQERNIARQARANAAVSEAMDVDEVLVKLADARLLSPGAPMNWAPLNEEEAEKFGEKVAEHLAENDPERHLDVSGAQVEGAGERIISGRRFEGLLAENTIWRGVEFNNCEFVDSSFASGRFENCKFRDCTFERVNHTMVTFMGCEFLNCTLRELQITEPVWMNSLLDECTLEGVSWTDPAAHDLTFRGGTWQNVQILQGLMIGLRVDGTELSEVTFVNTHAPHTRFRQLKLFKVWAMAKGFPGSVFEEIDANTCGFVGNCHFDESQFEKTSFTETGFTGAVFKDATFAPGCVFNTCDFSGAIFQNTALPGVRFLQCSMAMSVWSKVKASDAWFFGAIVRGVDFADTELARAVFMDADIEGAKFQPDKTIGADFRGTARESA